MSCQTCSSSMNYVGELFWCPRCGTINDGTIVVRSGVPALVKRCAKFYDEMECVSASFKAAWQRHGIAESIGKAMDRPESAESAKP